ncbi:MAG: type II toxin-antitoxin system VapC family toxin [Hyphomonadaceae bacterium]
MIILDTNVVSELMRETPAPTVAAWIAAQPRSTLFVCAPVMAELRFGVVRLPAGQRRDELTASYDVIVGQFRNRILSYDLRAAEAFADILVSRAKEGAPIQANDAQIAAIARTRNAAIATRDLGDFAGCGVALIDPWAG